VFVFQRNNVLTGIAVFGERETASPAYTLVDRTFDTCMLALFDLLLCQMQKNVYYVELLITK